MPDPNRVKGYAWVSQASYLGLGTLQKDATSAELTDALETSAVSQSNRFVPFQTDDFVAHPAYVFQAHHPNDISGFSASLFKHADGSYVFAVRGTELGIRDLLVADFLGIALSGAARGQAISAY